MTYSKIEITCSNVIKDAVEENCESDHDSWLRKRSNKRPPYAVKLVLNAPL